MNYRKCYDQFFDSIDFSSHQTRRVKKFNRVESALEFGKRCQIKACQQVESSPGFELSTLFCDFSKCELFLDIDTKALKLKKINLDLSVSLIEFILMKN